MVYTFNEQLKIGKEAEELIDSYLRSDYLAIQVVDLTLERLGIDRLLWSKQKPSRCISAQYKADFKQAKTGNIFFETEIEFPQGTKPGWVCSTIAQFVCLYVPHEKVILGIDMLDIKRNITAWADEFGTSGPACNQGASGGYFFGYGIAVPFERVREHSRRVITL